MKLKYKTSVDLNIHLIKIIMDKKNIIRGFSTWYLYYNSYISRLTVRYKKRKVEKE